jgi:cell division protein FtsQ
VSAANVGDLPLRRVILLAVLAALVGSTPWWGKRVLSSLAFFRVRSVEVDGAEYTAPGAVVNQLHIDTLASVWTDLGPLQARVRRMSGIRDASLRRKLPGTIVVRLVERTPVALVATPAGLRVYDGSATALPIDPIRSDVDLPVLGQLDSGALHLLANLREAAPAFYGRVSEVRRLPNGDLDFEVPGLRILARPTTEIARFSSVASVTADLARRHARVQELDLRYRDQIVARIL